ncbi:Solute carrier organic anion transporter family member 74D [Frankliniella fusca]|uniref:Solute carrier organic anion transporter family member 74D n=1 Tax=Frankliniella fusca TaxID=407009 RepID=A0AAE1GSS5_9NEOP|nr:Solute carrier organic anion transporter family member 74D [Frankliniella fusca]
MSAGERDKDANGAARAPLLEQGLAADGKKAAPELVAADNKKSDLEDLYRDLPLTDETTCGIGCVRSAWLQRFATKNVYVLVYGLLGCIFSASYAYSNGIITTLEKRFKIPSKTIGAYDVCGVVMTRGVITVGNDFTQLFVSVFLSYYAGKGHRPRWIAFGIYTVVLYCLLTALPHLMYGPGEDSLALTVEHGAVYDRNASREERGEFPSPIPEKKIEIRERSRRRGSAREKPQFSFLWVTLTSSCCAADKMERKVMCAEGQPAIQCDAEEGNLAPVAILFLAQLVSGIGGSLYYTIGVSYMDDNIKKDKTPALISFSYFLRMLGPCIGYALASFCLKLYISPSLSPTIDNTDPRWLGAWWLGWIILAVLLFLFASVLGLFPKTLPRAAARRAAAKEVKDKEGGGAEEHESSASLKDMLLTFKRLLQNPTLMCNNAASVFYFFGYMPYWIYMPKYIETQYRQSASSSSLVTGTVGIVFSGIGILLSGIVITKYRPNARQMALWNTLVGLIAAGGIVSYIFLGCPDNDSYGGLLKSNGELETSFQCNADCLCEYVKYSPVCASDGYTTYISACHAGCRDYDRLPSGGKVYRNCSCIAPLPDSLAETTTLGYTTPAPAPRTFGADTYTVGGTATPGACPVDCSHMFYLFLAVVCVLKFSGATGRATNFLVSVRCVEEKDKPVAMGLGITLMSLFAFMPSPIFFGYLMDATCLVWGKTCSGNGNCWLYNGESLRYLLNLTSAGFVLIGALFDAGVWYYVKDVQIFDDEEVKPVMLPVQPEMQMYNSSLHLDQVGHQEKDGAEDVSGDCELKDLSQMQNNILNHINQNSERNAVGGAGLQEEEQTNNKH